MAKCQIHKLWRLASMLLLLLCSRIGSTRAQDVNIFNQMQQCKTFLMLSDEKPRDDLLTKEEYRLFVNRYLQRMYPGTKAFQHLPKELSDLFDELAPGGELDIRGVKPGEKEPNGKQTSYLESVCSETVEEITRIMSVVAVDNSAMGFSAASLMQEDGEDEAAAEDDGGGDEPAQAGTEASEGGPPGDIGNVSGQVPEGGGGGGEGSCEINVNIDIQIQYPDDEFAACESTEQEDSIVAAIESALNENADSVAPGTAITFENLQLDFDQEVNNVDPFGGFRRRHRQLRGGQKLRHLQDMCPVRTVDCEADSADFCRWGCLKAKASSSCDAIKADSFAGLEGVVTESLQALATDGPIDCLGIPADLKVVIKADDPVDVSEDQPQDEELGNEDGAGEEGQAGGEEGQAGGEEGQAGEEGQPGDEETGGQEPGNDKPGQEGDEPGTSGEDGDSPMEVENQGLSGNETDIEDSEIDMEGEGEGDDESYPNATNVDEAGVDEIVDETDIEVEMGGDEGTSNATESEGASNATESEGDENVPEDTEIDIEGDEGMSNATNTEDSEAETEDDGSITEGSEVEIENDASAANETQIEQSGTEESAVGDGPSSANATSVNGGSSNETDIEDLELGNEADIMPEDMGDEDTTATNATEDNAGATASSTGSNDTDATTGSTGSPGSTDMNGTDVASSNTTAPTPTPTTKYVTVTSPFIVKTDKLLTDADLATLTEAYADFVANVVAGLPSSNSATGGASNGTSSAKPSETAGQHMNDTDTNSDATINGTGTNTEASMNDPDTSSEASVNDTDSGSEASINATDAGSEEITNATTEVATVKEAITDPTDSASNGTTTDGRRFLQGQRRRLARLNESSIEIYAIENATCPEVTAARMLQASDATDNPTTENSPGDSTVAATETPTSDPSSARADGICQKLLAKYDVIVEDGEDPEVVREQYTAATTEGIDNGQLQESIEKVDPDSTIVVEGSFEPPPAPTEPPTVPPGSDKGDATSAPGNGTNANTTAPESKDGEGGSNMLPIIIGSVCGALALCCCVGAGAFYMSQKSRSVSQEVEDEMEDPEKALEKDEEGTVENNAENEIFDDEDAGDDDFVHALEPPFEDKGMEQSPVPSEEPFEASFDKEGPPEPIAEVEEEDVNESGDEAFEDEPTESALKGSGGEQEAQVEEDDGNDDDFSEDEDQSKPADLFEKQDQLVPSGEEGNGLEDIDDDDDQSDNAEPSEEDYDQQEDKAADKWDDEEPDQAANEEEQEGKDEDIDDGEPSERQDDEHAPEETSEDAQDDEEPDQATAPVDGLELQEGANAEELDDAEPEQAAALSDVDAADEEWDDPEPDQADDPAIPNEREGGDEHWADNEPETMPDNAAEELNTGNNASESNLADVDFVDEPGESPGELNDDSAGDSEGVDWEDQDGTESG